MRLKKKEENLKLAPNTGDAKMDEAYGRLKEHIRRCKTFDEFTMHFSFIVKTDDVEVLNVWLLKVLYVLMRREDEHEFDRLLRLVDDEKAGTLRAWLKESLAKFG